MSDAKRNFYPTLLYTDLRNKIQSEFRWRDRIDELGAVPFPADAPRLLGTWCFWSGDFKRIILTSGPNLATSQHVSLEKTTYVRCKAGRGHSTIIVLCYLVGHRQMAFETAYGYVRSISPRVLLASTQWWDYCLLKVKKLEVLTTLPLENL